MNDHDRALASVGALCDGVSENRADPAESRGYAPLALALTAALAVIFGVAQPFIVSHPVARPAHYIGYWTIAAIFAVTILALEAARRSRAPYENRAEYYFVFIGRQFAPAGLAGAAVTLALLTHHPNVVSLLPGFWQIFLSLGAFAAAPARPRVLTIIGFYYLAAGLFCLVLADFAALSPFEMAAPLACGQTLAALLVHHESRRLRGERF